MQTSWRNPIPSECAEERSSEGRLRSNGEAARKGPRPRIKIQSLNDPKQVIGAGVVDGSDFANICVCRRHLRSTKNFQESNCLDRMENDS